MKKNKFLVFSLAFLSGAAAFAELQDLGGILMDPTLTENSDVNVVFDNSEGTYFSSLLGLIVMGSFSPDISLKSITSKISNIHANSDNSTFIGGSLGGVSGDIRSEISNCTINDVVGGNLDLFPNSNIGGSVYLTINSGSYGSVAGAYWDMDGSNSLKIGGSVNTTINGGTIVNLFGGSLDGGRSSAQNNIQMGDVNLVINASSSSDKISIGSVSGLNNSVRESAEKLSIVFTGNGENLDFTGTVSSIKSDSYASNLTWYALVKERVISFGSGEDSFVG